MLPLKRFEALIPIRGYAYHVTHAITKEAAADQIITRRCAVTPALDTVEIDWDRVKDQEAPPPGQSVRKNEYVQFQLKEITHGLS